MQQSKYQTPLCDQQIIKRRSLTFCKLQNFFYSVPDGLGRPTGISPLHGSHPTLLIAYDASNAQAVTVREYHCCYCRSSLIEFPVLFFGIHVYRSSKRSHRACTVSASCNRNVIRTTFYEEPPLSCGSFFSKSRLFSDH